MYKENRDMFIDLEIFFRVWIGGGGLMFNFMNFF